MEAIADPRRTPPHGDPIVGGRLTTVSVMVDLFAYDKRGVQRMISSKHGDAVVSAIHREILRLAAPVVFGPGSHVASPAHVTHATVHAPFGHVRPMLVPISRVADPSDTITVS